jgi:hypothetical protein
MECLEALIFFEIFAPQRRFEDQYSCVKATLRSRLWPIMGKEPLPKDGQQIKTWTAELYQEILVRRDSSISLSCFVSSTP